MKILVRVSSLILILTLSCTYFELTTERAVYPDGKNVIFFERVHCQLYSPQRVSNLTCTFKYIDRNNLRVYVAAHLPRPHSAAWVHGVIYYKYLTYQKIATEYWDDLCAWVAGERESYLLDFFKPLIRNYTNFNHSCPYTGLVFVKADNISAQRFVIPQIVPSGRYKIEANVTEGDRKTSLVGVTIFLSISDHRIEVV